MKTVSSIFQLIVLWAIAVLAMLIIPMSVTVMTDNETVGIVALVVIAVVAIIASFRVMFASETPRSA